MAQSAVSIANQALGLIGAQYITSIEEATTNARHVYVIYDDTKRMMLAAHQWSFATKRATLPKSAASSDEWSYVYEIPRDFISLVSFIGQKEPQRYRVEHATIYCNVDNAKVKYVADVPEQYFSPAFTQAFKYQLAGQLANPVKNSREMEQAYLQMASQMLFQARMQDAEYSAGVDAATWWTDRPMSTHDDIVLWEENG